MSGICGICELGFPASSANLRPMLTALALPGESEQSMVGDSTALGVSRRWPSQQLAALPGVRIAVDAELLNQEELVSLLKTGDGHSTMSPAELLARLYQECGVGFVELLDGVFSIALWDEHAQRVMLAVDRFGVKSLYWRKEQGRLLFASRAGAIRAEQKDPAQINPGALVQYLLLSVVPAPLTIYEGMERLRPGYQLLFEDGQVQQTQYWDLSYAESDNRDERYWACEVRESLRAAVHHSMKGCDLERTGAYLSGGTDSSSVVAFMNERHSPVETFSIYFQEAGFSELEFARTTAKHFRTRHHEKCLTTLDALEAITKIADYYDEPFANSSSIGAYSCAQMAQESGVETLLAGDGGDELFAGNERYAKDKTFGLYHSLPSFVRRGFVDPVAALLPQDGGWLSLPARYVRRARILNPRRMFSYGFLHNIAPEEVFEPDFLAQAPPGRWLDVVEGHYWAARAKSELNRLMYFDVKVTLADNDLRKVVGTAELAGVRVRFPLLDRRLAELSARIPSTLKLKNFKKRYIFKQAMKGILPSKVLNKRKHGFGVPLGGWLLSDARLHAWMRDLLGDSRARQRGYFRADFVDRLTSVYLQEHPNFYGEIVWFLMALEMWHRRHFERSPENVHAT